MQCCYIGKMKKIEDNIVRLLKLFERELPRYRPILNQNNFHIFYIIKKKKFSNGFDVKILFEIKNEDFWKVYAHQPRKMKRQIRTYTEHFSFSDFSILKPIEFSQTISPVPSIKERITFEYFGHISEFDFQ